MKAQTVRRTTRLALIATFAASCEGFEPCKRATYDRIDGSQYGDKLLSGTWTLNLVDGKGMPFDLPGGKGRVVSGELSFYTYDIDEGSCHEPRQSSGEVIALYLLAGAQKKTRAGTFTYAHRSGGVTISALGRTAGGSAALGSPQSTMNINAPLPGDTTPVSHILQFIRR